MRPLLLAGLWVGCVMPAASAEDLSQLDRSIAKLPEFRAPAQKYCLLVFGQRADTRVWVVRDGDRLYIDANANGDLTEPGERHDEFAGSFSGETIVECDGTRHEALSISDFETSSRVSVRSSDGLVQMAFRDARGKLKFSTTPADAPIVHFNGPVTMDQFWHQQPLSSTEARRVSIVVGTPGVGDGTFATFRCGCFLKSDDGVSPRAEIEFAHRDPAQPALHQEARLSEA